MTKIKLFNQQGEDKGYLELPDTVFALPMNSDLLHQAVRVLQIRKRPVLADTKTRSEVRGGGKKPWRQKGTGRARQGSIRAPQWRGGGAVFGPQKEKQYTAQLPIKMKRKAMCVALSAKVRDGEVFAVDAIQLPEAKTKYMADVVEKLTRATSGVQSKNKKALLVVAFKNETVFRAGRNLSGIQIISADRVNLLDILSKKLLIMTSDSIPVLEKRLR